MSERNPSFPSYGSVDPVQVTVVKTEFDPKEFNSICEKVSSNIYRIQNGASNLSSSLRQIEKNMYTTTLRDRIHDIQQKTNPVINNSTNYLQQITAMARSGNKQNKLQAERLRTEFQDTVKYYSNLQKQIADKIKSAILRSTNENMSQTTDWSTTDDNKMNVLEQEAAEKEAQKQLTSEIQTDYELFLEREQRIRQIETDMIDVNEIFRDLAAMVHEQGEVVDTLENHIEDTSHNVEQGRNQLQQAALYQKKYRKKICCLILLLVTIAVIITIVIVTTR